MDWKSFFWGLLVIAVIIVFAIILLSMQYPPNNEPVHLGTVSWEDVESFIFNFK